jgi:hypothetical protein
MSELTRAIGGERRSGVEAYRKGFRTCHSRRKPNPIWHETPDGLPRRHAQSIACEAPRSFPAITVSFALGVVTSVVGLGAFFGGGVTDSFVRDTGLRIKPGSAPIDRMVNSMADNPRSKPGLFVVGRSRLPKT